MIQELRLGFSLLTTSTLRFTRGFLPYEKWSLVEKEVDDAQYLQLCKLCTLGHVLVGQLIYLSGRFSIFNVV